MAQRTVLYLGEVNDQEAAAWRKSLEVFDEDRQSSLTLSLFPEDREIPQDAVDGLQVKLSGLELRRTRVFGNCWLACELWRQLDLDGFWQQRLPEGREAVSCQKWADLFHADFEVLLYDLTSTYFEGEMEEKPKAKRGYSRDGRPDCLQVVIALVITPDGFPLAYEVMDGNTSDRTTLRGFLDQIENTYGQAKRM